MIMGRELEKYNVVDSLGKVIGKISDVIIDTTKKKWDVKEIIVTKRMVKGKRVFSFSGLKKFDESEEKIELKEGTKLQVFDEEKYSPKYLSMDAVKKRKVFSSDEEKIGKIYDYVISTKLIPWQVKKILIRPYEDQLKGRRIRLDVENISQIKDVIIVKKSKVEVEKQASEE